MDNLSDSQFGISLPSKKYIDNIHNILKITDIVSKVNVYGSPVMNWYEFDVIYKNHSSVTLSYETIRSAINDKKYLENYIETSKNNIKMDIL